MEAFVLCSDQVEADSAAELEVEVVVGLGHWVVAYQVPGSVVLVVHLLDH